MIFDGHVHVAKTDTPAQDQAAFADQLNLAGITGGLLISLPPASFTGPEDSAANPARLDDVLSWCRPQPDLYPFYWIDPLEEDAPRQVHQAVDAGILGFKVICDRFSPSHPQALNLFHTIAQHARPILFHSGILWDGKASSVYNRPAGFEALLDIPKLKFALAHISWPWCDELIAVYGKFLHAHTQDPQSAVEMFIDTSPGTPAIYRRDALTKLFTVGYDVQNNVIFGSDGFTTNYNSQWAREWIQRDQEIFADLHLEPQTLNAVYAENLKRFVGKSKELIEKKPLLPAQ